MVGLMFVLSGEQGYPAYGIGNTGASGNSLVSVIGKGGLCQCFPLTVGRKGITMPFLFCIHMIITCSLNI